MSRRAPCSSLALAALLVAGCGGGRPATPRDEAPRRVAAADAGSASSEAAPAVPLNVVLVSVDTLRADHLGYAGYGRNTTPNIDLFCAESAFFSLAMAQAPSTLPSHASMLSSLVPSHHGAFFSRSQRLPSRITTLPESVAAAGWRTAAVVGGGQMAPEFGLDQGFELYEVTAGDAPFEETVARGVEWLDSVHDEPFFLFLHTYEVHHPYTPSRELLARFDDGYRGPLPPWISKELLRRINAEALAFDVEPLSIDEADLAYIVAAYDAEIRSMDAAFGNLLAALSQRGLLQRTMVILSSDHGEEFGEHGVVGWHSHTLFEELLAVPLVIRFPDSRHQGARVDELVRNIDIAPTVLAELGLEPPGEFEGRGLQSLLEGSAWWSELPAVSRMDGPPGMDFAAVRDGRYRLYPNGLHKHALAYRHPSPVVRTMARIDIMLRPYLLFDLAADPGERRVSAALKHGGRRRSLTEELARVEAARPAASVETTTVSTRTEEQLRALGYLE